MKIFNLFGFVIFWGLAFADALLIFQNMEQYRIYTKPLLVPVLILTIFATISRRKNGTFKTLLAIALLLATIGDIVLLKAGPTSQLFKIGIACFLFTHLLFTIYFFKIYAFSISKPTAALATFIPLAAIAVWFIIFLKPYLNNLFIPVAIYSFFILLMVSAAANLLHSTTMRNTAIETFIPGALLFVLSDFMLAINTFYFEEQVINSAVMLTYSGALFYLSKGFIKHLHKRSTKTRRKKLDDLALN